MAAARSAESFLFAAGSESLERHRPLEVTPSRTFENFAVSEVHLSAALFPSSLRFMNRLADTGLATIQEPNSEKSSRVRPATHRRAR